MKPSKENCEFRTCCKRDLLRCPCDLWHRSSDARNVLVDLCQLENGLLSWEIDRLDKMWESEVLSEVDKQLLKRLSVRLL